MSGLVRMSTAYANTPNGTIIAPGHRQPLQKYMKAIIKAILLDPEARICPTEDDALGGKLREPLIRYTHVAKALNAFTESGIFRNSMSSFYNLTFQRVLGAPSVFNFFQSTHQPLGGIEENNLVAPEFQIVNSVSVLGYANEVHDWVMKDYEIFQWQTLFNGETGGVGRERFTNLDLSYEIQLGKEGRFDELLERLDLLLTHGQMTDKTKELIKNAISQFPTVPNATETDAELRGRTAIFLTLISPDYLIIR